MNVHVGTSGYNYPEWRGTFYPEGWPATKMFGFYAARFSTVEINYTFYRMPTLKTTTAWQQQAPAGFLYALKAPRRITHDKRLKDCEEDVRFFCESAQGLGPHLGPVLFQLSPHFKADVGRLEALLAGLPPGIRSAFEFRHASWLTDGVYDALSRHGAALCIADAGERSTPMVRTARHGYLRLRDEGYGRADLERWADQLVAGRADWDDVYVYFKHEEAGTGPEFARILLGILKDRGITA